MMNCCMLINSELNYHYLLFHIMSKTCFISPLKFEKRFCALTDTPTLLSAEITSLNFCLNSISMSRKSQLPWATSKIATNSLIECFKSGIDFEYEDTLVLIIGTKYTCFRIAQYNAHTQIYIFFFILQRQLKGN